MKKKSSVLSLLLAGLLAVAGCSGPAASSSSSAPAASSGAGSTAASSKPAESASVQKPIEMWYAYSNNADTLPGGTADSVSAKVLEQFNVDLRFEFIATSSYAEKINVMIASGDFPDIFDTQANTLISEAADAGMLLPLTSILDSDPWSEVDRDKLQRFMYKGDLYGLPAVVDLPNGIYYRTDWLDKLGMDIPTSPEELYQVMKAFTEQDPDGNGKNDTFGLTMRSDFGQSDPLWNMFLPISPMSNSGFYYDETADEVSNVFYLKEDLEEAVNWFRRLYSEGILDREFVLTKSEESENKFLSGQSGCWLKGFMWIGPRQVKIQKNNPDAQILCFPAIEGKYGTNLKINPAGRALMLTRRSADYADTAKEVVSYLCSPEGTRDLIIGQEGVTYKVEDGKLVWTNPDDASKYNPGNLLSCALPLELPVDEPVLTKNIEVTKNYRIMPYLNFAESETYTDNAADMKKVISEGLTKIIIGEQPVEYLDTMASELDKLGMKQICQELKDLRA